MTELDIPGFGQAMTEAATGCGSVGAQDQVSNRLNNMQKKDRPPQAKNETGGNRRSPPVQEEI